MGLLTARKEYFLLKNVHVTQIKYLSSGVFRAL